MLLLDFYIIDDQSMSLVSSPLIASRDSKVHADYFVSPQAYQQLLYQAWSS